MFQVDYMKYDINKDTILFKNQDDFFGFLRWLTENCGTWDTNLDKYTILQSIGHLENFFGIQFGNDSLRPEDEDWNYTEEHMKDIVIKDDSVTPTSYPCLFLTYSVNGLSYAGSKTNVVNFSSEPIFIYPSDFNS